MAFRVIILKTAEKSLERLHSDVQRRVYQALVSLEDNPRPSGIKALQGDHPGYRLRVGSYRSLYTVDDQKQTVSVYKIGHRKDVYR